MVTKEVLAFYDAVVASPVLQERLKVLASSAGPPSEEKLAVAVRRVALEAGFDLPLHDVHSALVEATAVHDGRRGPEGLSDAQLESVAGGIGRTEGGSYGSSTRFGSLRDNLGPLLGGARLIKP